MQDKSTANDNSASSVTVTLPTLLALAAGFVDACTFLAFAGFFVAQVTGSYVVAGSEIAAHNFQPSIKILAIPVFVLAGILTTLIVRSVGENWRAALTITLCVEAVLLGGLSLTGVVDLPSGLGDIPALLGLSAMGVQSALVRLLLANYGSTNVMTTNTTQLSIEITDSFLRGGVSLKLLQVGSIMLGFLSGVGIGSFAYGNLGLASTIFPAGLVLCIAGVEAWRGTVKSVRV